MDDTTAAGLAPSPVRRALILAGGGMRVAYQAGVVRALFEDGLGFTHVDGTSGGILNTAMLLSGLSPEAMCERWRTLDVKAFASLVPLEQYLKPNDLLAMGDADGLVETVFPHLGIDVDRIHRAGDLVGTFNVCNYPRKTVESIPNDRVALEHLIAGVSLPIFMPPVRYGDVLYTDAVWIKDANLMEAVRRGADELWLVWCIGNTSEYHRGLLPQYVHMIEMSANGGLFEEFERIRELNDRIERGEAVLGRTRPVRLHVIRPETPLPLDPDFFFGRITATTLIALGYADARRYLRAATAEGVPFQPEVTHMTAGTPGIRFSESMYGGFALDETDPRAGAARGQANGTTLTLHATITIRDLDRFLADQDHRGELVGTVDFPPLASGMPTENGVFKLFAPGADAATKLMIYEAGFRHAGKPYFLAGQKEVHDDPGFDLWTDTTTLFTRLHQGTDRSGPVVGAGILRLTADDFRRVLATIRPIDAPSTGAGAVLVARFGKFFARELWDTYGITA